MADDGHVRKPKERNLTMEETQSSWGTGEKVTLGAAVLLLLDLIALPWHVYAGSWYSTWDAFGSYTQTTGPSSSNGVQGSGAFFGVLVGLTTVALIVRTILQRTDSEMLRSVPEVWRKRPVLEAGIAVLVGLKLMTNTSNLGFGVVVTVALASAILLGRYLTAHQPQVVSDPPVNATSSIDLRNGYGS